MAPERDRPMKEPKFIGRFNYFSYTADHYNIMFVPYHSPVTVIIAKNLTWDEMNSLLRGLNHELDVASDVISDNVEGEER